MLSVARIEIKRHFNQSGIILVSIRCFCKQTKSIGYSTSKMPTPTRLKHTLIF